MPVSEVHLSEVPPVSEGRCAKCDHLRWQAQELRIERDTLLVALAREKERANAFYLSYPAQSLPPPAPSESPLRHRVVDAINFAVKGKLPFLHRAARKAGASLKSFLE